jgi:hypothetical protein
LTDFRLRTALGSEWLIVAGRIKSELAEESAALGEHADVLVAISSLMG